MCRWPRDRRTSLSVRPTSGSLSVRALLCLCGKSMVCRQTSAHLEFSRQPDCLLSLPASVNRVTRSCFPLLLRSQSKRGKGKRLVPAAALSGKRSMQEDVAIDAPVNCYLHPIEMKEKIRLFSLSPSAECDCNPLFPSSCTLLRPGHCITKQATDTNTPDVERGGQQRQIHALQGKAGRH